MAPSQHSRLTIFCFLVQSLRKRRNSAEYAHGGGAVITNTESSHSFQTSALPQVKNSKKSKIFLNKLIFRTSCFKKPPASI